MIVTELYEGQGLGNQLWVYAACKGIAEQLGYPHAVLGMERFKGRAFLTIDSGRPTETAVSERAGDFSDRLFSEQMYYDHELQYVASDFDEDVLRLPPRTRIEGLFQSERYLFGGPAAAPRYVSVRPEYLRKQLVPPDACILNIRGGEYKRHKAFILPRSYWVNAMCNARTRLGIDRFVIVTDDPRYARAMFPETPVLRGGIAECYVALYQARSVIVSNSTFSYFPIATGSPKALVIAPRLWARFGNRYGRWASPANLYAGWFWQDPEGRLSESASCEPERDATIRWYRETFRYAVAREAIRRRTVRDYIPGAVKRWAKTALSLAFPRKFG